MVRRLLRAQAADPLPAAAATLVALSLVSPWLLDFDAKHAAVANHVAIAMAFVPLALLITALRPAAACCLAGGVWLAVSPWLLGYASAGVTAWGSDLALGGTLALISWRAGWPHRNAVISAHTYALGRGRDSRFARRRDGPSQSPAWWS